MGQSAIQTSKVDFATLTEIEDVEQLSKTDEQILEELRDVILAHGKGDRIGVVLIHKHFEVGPDEKAVETYYPDERVSKIEVVKDGGENDGTIQSMWRFAKEKAV